MGSLRNNNQISHLGPLNGQYRHVDLISVWPRHKETAVGGGIRNAPRGQAPVKDGHLFGSLVPKGFRNRYRVF
jgi:hypothetical protein